MIKDHFPPRLSFMTFFFLLITFLIPIDQGLSARAALPEPAIRAKAVTGKENTSSVAKGKSGLTSAAIPLTFSQEMPLDIVYHDSENFPVSIENLAKTGGLHMSLEVQSLRELKKNSIFGELEMVDLGGDKKHLFITGKAASFIKGKKPQHINMNLLTQRELMSQIFKKSQVDITEEGQIKFTGQKNGKKKHDVKELQGRILELGQREMARRHLREIRFLNALDSNIHQTLGPAEKVFLLTVEEVPKGEHHYDGSIITELYEVNRGDTFVISYYIIKFPVERLSWVPFINSIVKSLAKSKFRDSIKRFFIALRNFEKLEKQES